MPAHVAARDHEGGGQPERHHQTGDQQELERRGPRRSHRESYAAESHEFRRYPWAMDPEVPADVTEGPRAAARTWQPGIPSLREHLPSLVWGAALPIARLLPGAPPRAHRRPGPHHRRRLLRRLGRPAVRPAAPGRPRRRRRPLRASRVGVVSSTLLGGNAYVLKVRDAAFTAALRRRLHRHALHARPSRVLLRRPLPLGGNRPRQGVRLRPAARGAHGAAHLPRALGGLGHRVGRRGGVRA